MELKQVVNSKYGRLFSTKKRYAILMGGRGAGRSTVASQYANAKLVSNEYFRCAIMRYILGDIRNSIYREIIDRATENEISEALSINDSNMTIGYGLNTINAVGFKKSSGEQKSKLKSLANYNCVIIEEADEIGEADFTQLDDSLRTVKGDTLIILLLNPPAKNHWIVNRWFDLKDTGIKDFYEPVLKQGVKDVEFIRTSFEDNIENIAEATVERYRGYEVNKPVHFYNMIKGYVPETVKGKIYSNWAEIDTVPHEARLSVYGLDFGYSNDPTAIVAIYYYNGGYILDEVVYQLGMSNRDIANTLKLQTTSIVMADSAEPKSIDEIKLHGINIQPVKKGAGSINQGIQFIQSEKISFTKRSVNIKKEYENYSWMQNKDGESQNDPKDLYNHAMDAIRYGFTIFKPVEEIQSTYTQEPEEVLFDGIGI